MGFALPTPRLMSVTIFVPRRVPSVRHSSRPKGDIVAANSSVEASRRVKYAGSDPLTPASMSFTRMVPALVPSEIHSSRPARM